MGYYMLPEHHSVLCTHVHAKRRPNREQQKVSIESALAQGIRYVQHGHNCTFDCENLLEEERDDPKNPLSQMKGIKTS